MTEETQPASAVGASVSPAPPEPPLRGLRRWALIAEIAAAASVVVSLIFVGLQLAQANELAREAAEQKQIESMGSISRMLAENPDLADIWAKGLAGEELTPGERVALTSMITYGQRTWEALYYQYRAGRVDPELWEAHRMQARAVQNTPMSRAMWELRKGWFSKSYREFRDSDGAGAEPGPLDYSIPPPVRAPQLSAPPAETRPQ